MGLYLYSGTSWFLCCKHLVYAVCPMAQKCFVEVKHNWTTPFWSHLLLVPVYVDPEYSCQGDVLAGTGDSSSQIQADGDNDDEEGENMILGENNGTFCECPSDHIKTLWDFCNSLEYKIQFEDQWILATVEWEGVGLFWLANNCLSREVLQLDKSYMTIKHTSRQYHCQSRVRWGNNRTQAWKEYPVLLLHILWCMITMHTYPLYLQAHKRIK